MSDKKINLNKLKGKKNEKIELSSPLAWKYVIYISDNSLNIIPTPHVAMGSTIIYKL